jgi:hypothetical protein
MTAGSTVKIHEGGVSSGQTQTCHGNRNAAMHAFGFEERGFQAFQLSASVAPVHNGASA